MRNILVTMQTEAEHRDMLKAAAPDAQIVYKKNSELMQQDVDAAEIIFGNPPPALIKNAKNLKLLQLFTAGTDGYLPVLPEGCALANTTGAFGLAIGEHMLASTLMLMKRLHQYRDNQARREWKDMGGVTSLEGATVVVLGLGDIGGAFAAKCKALGAYVIGVRRADAKKPDYADELVLTRDIDAVLPRADVVGMALPDTPETSGMLDARRIAMLKEGAIVVNVGRGSAIDQDALADAIEKRGIRAALDVTVPEPLPPESRLWGLENCLVTPHISGFFHLRATQDRMVMIACENIRRYIAKRPLINLVDCETGYRKNKYDGGKDAIQ